MRFAGAILLVFLGACIRHGHEQDVVDEDFDIHANHFPTKTELRHAEYFTVTYHGYWKEVTVLDAPGGNRVVHLALLPHGAPVPAEAKNLEVVRIPLKASASISTTHLPMIAALNELHTLKAFAAFDYLNNLQLLAQLKAQKVADIGAGGKVEREGLLNSGAEVLFSYLFGQDSESLNVKGVAVVPVSEYLEQSPLAAAEWIKFFALFWNREAEAESFFGNVESSYLQLAERAKNGLVSRSVFTGLPWKNEWNMPAGNSSVARLLADAGLDYVYAETDAKGNLSLSMEEVINDALDADVWILVTYFNGKTNMADLTAVDDRFGRFKAVKQGMVWLCDLSTADYFGQGVLRPDILLQEITSLNNNDASATLTFFKKLAN